MCSHWEIQSCIVRCCWANEVWRDKHILSWLASSCTTEEWINTVCRGYSKLLRVRTDIVKCLVYTCKVNCCEFFSPPRCNWRHSDMWNLPTVSKNDREAYRTPLFLNDLIGLCLHRSSQRGWVSSLLRLVPLKGVFPPGRLLRLDLKPHLDSCKAALWLLLKETYTIKNGNAGSILSSVSWLCGVSSWHVLSPCISGFPLGSSVPHP